ncbi:Na/Pi cotransporter family protein [Mesorhizobium sp. YR577]|uniref:Na/Pi cotransporter family protein n=1 Tax=Mesorhizobium sp. YR577 TaxID=1884373 RepID=UPI0008EE4FB2|nr:Na/Pi cotransporter family protein [Mesorhizobium sp. YR577]SFT84779.1 phosphate:Na+ symporter [Mesorhizobium sp. YR577]
MHFSIILLHLAGATLLLLYAVHLVRTGMERAHAPILRQLFGEARGGHIRAAAGGAAMAVMLQSSTAVAMLACGFAAGAVLALPTGLALLLGADLGSALVVRVLSFDLGWLIPVCLLAGGVMHLKLPGQKIRETGRMVLGVGFVLLSLKLLGEATDPLRNAELLPMISGYLAQDYLTAFLLGAVFTWLIHSSVAAVLMITALASQGLVSLEAGIPLILGANVGSGLIAFWLSRGMGPAARRLPLGNLIFRACGTVVALVAIQLFSLPVGWLGDNAGVALINLHVLFNACLGVFSLPLTGAMARLTTTLLSEAPVRTKDDDLVARRITALDRAVTGVPTLALASATRELLRMGELVELMFRPVMDMFKSGTSEQIARLRSLDEDVNDAHTGIKLYIAEVNRGRLTSEEARRGIELTDVAINLEHAGDVIAKNLLVLAAERSEKNLNFSKEGWAEMTDLHARVAENMQLALNVLISNDLAAARQLVAEKERIRTQERQSHEQHLRRLQSGKMESIETSDIHLEAVRAFKEINSLLVTIAYPLLTQSGDLQSSRLVRLA